MLGSSIERKSANDQPLVDIGRKRKATECISEALSDVEDARPTDQPAVERPGKRSKVAPSLDRVLDIFHDANEEPVPVDPGSSENRGTIKGGEDGLETGTEAGDTPTSETSDEENKKTRLGRAGTFPSELLRPVL
jgi:hypothetical protein